MAHIKNRGFPLQVKNEHQYTRTLRKCFNNPNVIRIDNNSIMIIVKIDRQGNVISGYGKIGELAWEDQEYYFELYGREEHTTKCKLYTRTGELFGAYLSITMGKHTADRILAKNLTNVELTPKPSDDIGSGFLVKLLGWLK